jgi:tubulin-specific chaperone A
LYRKEAEEQQKKLDKFIADGAEDWDIKNGVRCFRDCILMVDEANKMIKVSADGLGKSIGELRDLVVRLKQ